MSPEFPPNGRFFTKEELLKRIKTSDLTADQKSSEAACILTMYDLIETAPLDQLLFMIANRLSMVNGQHVGCLSAATILINTANIAAIGYKISEDHERLFDHNKRHL